MAKILHCESFGPEPLNPDMRLVAIRPDRIEIPVTPEPKIRKQKQANAKAERLRRVQAGQEANAHAPGKQSESKRTAQRKRARDLYYHAVQTDKAAGRITAEQAKERLTKRRFV